MTSAILSYRPFSSMAVLLTPLRKATFRGCCPSGLGIVWVMATHRPVWHLHSCTNLSTDTRMQIVKDVSSPTGTGSSLISRCGTLTGSEASWQPRSKPFKGSYSVGGGGVQLSADFSVPSPRDPMSSVQARPGWIPYTEDGAVPLLRCSMKYQFELLLVEFSLAC